MNTAILVWFNMNSSIGSRKDAICGRNAGSDAAKRVGDKPRQILLFGANHLTSGATARAIGRTNCRQVVSRRSHGRPAKTPTGGSAKRIRRHLPPGGGAAAHGGSSAQADARQGRADGSTDRGSQGAHLRAEPDQVSRAR